MNCVNMWLVELSRIADCFVSAHPNAGLPNTFGEYYLGAQAMARHIGEWAHAGLLNIGGGTTPEHISALVNAVEGGRRVLCRLVGMEPLNITATSLFVNVGNRTNVTG